MANTPEYSLYYPTTSDTVHPASRDLRDMQTTVEAGLKTVRQNASWYKGVLPSGTDLNTWLEVGLRSTDTSAITATIANKPSGFTQPFTIETIVRSATNGVYRQTASMKITGVYDSIEMYRDSLLVGGVVTFGGEWRSARDTISRDTSMITIIGDSQSERSVTSWDVYAGAKLDGTTFVNHARSGDESNTVLFREGINPIICRVEGGVIPASGSVQLTTSMYIQERDNRLLIGGTLNNIAGTLTYVSPGVLTFTRSTAGSSVNVPSFTEFRSSWGPGGSSATTAHALLAWFGGNDFNYEAIGQERTIADHVIGNYRRFVDYCLANGYQPIIAGVTNRLTALAGSDGFAMVQRINRELRRMFPNIFLDVQAYYVERAIYDAGLTPTAADLEAMSRGEIPPQLYVAGDPVHLTPAAHQAIGEYWIAPWLALKGYARTTLALEQLPLLKPEDMQE